jgi:plastocyanin
VSAVLRLGLAAVLGVAVGAGAAWAGVHVVDQKDLRFSTATLKLAKGDTVEFTNSDDTVHNITIAGNGLSISSGLQAPGRPFKVPMVKIGVYQVRCGIHPGMKMTLVVE